MIDITWAGGEHSFALKIEHLRALQEKCDAGPAHILARLATNQWLVDDVVQTIRLGLEGGGMDKAVARKIVKKHVEDEPLTLSVMTARAVLMSALYGAGDDPVGESEGEAATQGQNSPMESGDFPAFTETAL